MKSHIKHQIKCDFMTRTIRITVSHNGMHRFDRNINPFVSYDLSAVSFYVNAKRANDLCLFSVHSVHYRRDYLFGNKYYKM